MAELTIRPEEIRDALENFVQSYKPDAASREEVGTVTVAGDGIAKIEGLPSAMANELLKFEDGTLGLALNLEEREIGAVVLGEFSGIEEGQPVQRTGEVLSVAVGEGYLGRVVDPLGNPIDGLGEIETTGRRALELQAPGVMVRKSVHEPMETGYKAVDAMTPIGRGQRQLVIGDRQTGKTALAVDTIINQRDNWRSGDTKKQVRCIYVAIGQKGSTIASVRGALEEAGALEYTTIVAAPASDPAGFNTLRRTPVRPSVSSGCTRASTSSSSSTTSRSRPTPTAPCPCCSAVRRGARPTPVTSSTCTPVCWSAARSSPTTWAPVR